jgi:5-methylcytosine-specific restriction endonuclease McrA
MTNGPSHLTDAQLVAAVKEIATRERASTAELVEHFAELEARGLHLAAGFTSLYEYCREVLHLTEDRACNRIAAARAAREYPVILQMLADGRLNLSTLRLLIPHLGSDHAQLLAEAAFRSKREIRELLARRAPRPDVPAAVRRLPSVEPLAPDRYLFKFTGDGETVALLRQAQDSLRHTIPDGDAALIFKRALAHLVADLERKKSAATERPQRTRGVRVASRDIPANVKRAVWVRDEGQCCYVGDRGRRCAARGFLQFHHVAPYITGGAPSVENIALRCRAHNQYEADRFFAPIRAAMSAHHSTRPGTDDGRRPPARQGGG